MSNIAVIGGTGYAGRHIVAEAAGRVAAAEGQLRAAWTPLAHWFADQAEAPAAARR